MRNSYLWSLDNIHIVIAQSILIAFIVLFVLVVVSAIKYFKIIRPDKKMKFFRKIYLFLIVPLILSITIGVTLAATQYIHAEFGGIYPSIFFHHGFYYQYPITESKYIFIYTDYLIGDHNYSCVLNAKRTNDKPFCFEKIYLKNDYLFAYDDGEVTFSYVDKKTNKYISEKKKLRQAKVTKYNLSTGKKDIYNLEEVNNSYGIGQDDFKYPRFYYNNYWNNTFLDEITIAVLYIFLLVLLLLSAIVHYRYGKRRVPHS